METTIEKFKILEALLFLKGEEGLEPAEIRELFQTSIPEARKMLKKFAKQFNSNQLSGLKITERVDVFRILTKPELHDSIAKFVNINKRRRLSDSSLETIAIIAYRQPISKATISEIRGVISDGVVNTLLNKKLIQEVGISKKTGRAILYGVTKKFYEYFQINQLKDLPIIDELKEQGEKEVFKLMELPQSNKENKIK